MSTPELEPLLQQHQRFWQNQSGILLKQVTSYVPLQAQTGIPLADGSWAKSRPLFSNVQGNLHSTAQGLWLLSLLQQEENYQALATH